jgi:hypothetical protein
MSVMFAVVLTSDPNSALIISATFSVFPVVLPKKIAIDMAIFSPRVSVRSA